MPKQSKRWRLEYAGWLFFIVAFFVLLAPGIFLFLRLRYEGVETSLAVGFGMIFAAFGAAILTWATNQFLFWRRARLAATAQAARKKGKRR